MKSFEIKKEEGKQVKRYRATKCNWIADQHDNIIATAVTREGAERIADALNLIEDQEASLREGRQIRFSDLEE